MIQSFYFRTFNYNNLYGYKYSLHDIAERNQSSMTLINYLDLNHWQLESTPRKQQSRNRPNYKSISPEVPQILRLKSGPSSQYLSYMIQFENSENLFNICVNTNSMVWICYPVPQNLSFIINICVNMNPMIWIRYAVLQNLSFIIQILLLFSYLLKQPTFWVLIRTVKSTLAWRLKETWISKLDLIGSDWIGVHILCITSYLVFEILIVQLEPKPIWSAHTMLEILLIFELILIRRSRFLQLKLGMKTGQIAVKP